MSYYQKFVSTFSGKNRVLLLSAAFFTLSSFTADRANFSGEWKLNESKSELGRMGIFCLTDNIYAFKIMKIAGQADFLIVDVASPSSDGALVIGQEKLAFDGKNGEGVFGSTKKKSTAKWSDDGQTMTVNSVIYFQINGETTEIKVTEVWKLINDGKSILLQSNSNSTTFGENAMRLVYDRAS